MPASRLHKSDFMSSFEAGAIRAKQPAGRLQRITYLFESHDGIFEAVSSRSTHTSARPGPWTGCLF